MKKENIYILLLLFFSLFQIQCSHRKEINENSSEQAQIAFMDSLTNEEINQLNQQTWQKARELTFSDEDFLQTKQPMSDDAIAPYDYHTGIVGDKAYNQRVYIQALERAKKHLSVNNNQLVLNIHSGAEINIAEDLFEYIVDLFHDWNKWINEGRFEIIQTDEGYYDIKGIAQK